jgi:hypothetical protein
MEVNVITSMRLRGKRSHQWRGSSSVDADNYEFADQRECCDVFGKPRLGTPCADLAFQIESVGLLERAVRCG